MTIVAIGFAISLPAMATVCDGVSYNNAKVQCQSVADHYNTLSTTQHDAVCLDKPTFGAFYVEYHYTNGSAGEAFGAAYTCAPPPPGPSSCANLNSGQGQTFLQGKALVGFSFPEPYTDPVSGLTIQCAMTFTPLSPPTLNPNSGEWETRGMFSASGNLANGSGWKDGSGATPSPAPQAPTLPDPGKVSPDICGGGSCYDPNTDQYCGTSGGAQFCVSGSTARSAAGGCTSSGGATVCAGSPTPPNPSASAVPNPLTSIRSSDQTTQANTSTGALQVVTTNVYGLPGTTITSGAKTGDVTPPASASSTAGDGTSSSGGGDCNTPPIVGNSPALAQIALQTWKTRCAIEANNSTGGVVGGLGTLYTPSTDTSASVVADFEAGLATTPVGESVTGFFNVGGVGGACPEWTVPANDWLPAQTFDFYCNPALSDLLDMAKFVLLIGCAYAAWRIAMGDA